MAKAFTKKERRRGGRAGRVEERRPRFQGWLSTDEEEIERRRQRAQVEPLTVEALEADEPVFGTFRVGSAGGRVGSAQGSAYEVEIRSRVERDNSCGCPDHRVNGLGTCKHIEAALARLERRSRAQAASPRAEIFLRRSGERPEVRIQWPEGPDGSRLGALLGPFFTAGGRLRGNPATALPALARTVGEAPFQLRKRIRLSRQLLPWADEERRRAARSTARERFLADVQAGRQSLDLLKLPLYPYQQEGMLHLAFTERALLADEMGLGKTIQAIAACELLRRLRGIERVLVISPTSLKGEWEEQIARFTDLPVRILQGTRPQRLLQYKEGAFFYLANYEQVLIDGADMQERLAPDVVILDEAQRIKNWQSRTAQAVKRLRSPYAFVLTGTPLENRIDEIYSIVQFLDPALFGPLFRFNRQYYDLDDRGRPVGYRNLDELHRRLAPILLRRRKSEVEGQLPGRTDKHYFVPMDAEQGARYGDYELRVSRLAAAARRRPLTPDEFKKLQQWLACMRMLCDTPYILDSDCRVCPKLHELEEILGEVLADREAKVLIFSEWERMLELVRELAGEMGLGFAWHTGSVPQMARRQEIRRFKEDPECRLFLSTESGGVGLNLQAANVVINLDLPWNPARLEQRIARAWRKHQTRPVQVLHLVTEDSIEHRMLPLLAGKQALADGVLDGVGDLSAMPLPSGRKALVARLEALMRPTEPPPPAAGGLRDDVVAKLGEHVLLLEMVPGSGGETLFAVVDQNTAPARRQIETLLAEQQAGAASPPALEVIDRATLETIERLAKAGVLQLAPGARLLHRAATLDRSPEADDAERTRRLARARELFEQAERKIRMAAVLASGGFPLEALPSLREGVDLGVRSWAHLQGEEPAGQDGEALVWGEKNLPRPLPLLGKLRGGPEALLGVAESEVRSWIDEGARWAEELGREMAR
ncbi:MAG TPA: DEAD/DEAH box helicase [Thermoanaerobaculia bacterium]|nr:DEAD/DEAH box helicase [Thermoanaerobaculia bacterium]